MKINFPLGVASTLRRAKSKRPRLQRIFLAILLLCSMQANAQFAENFDNPSRPLLIRGRGDCRTTDGVFRSQSAYACFGDETLRNCRITFSARAPKDAEQVQIWAGFRAANRFDRYVLGMKGGLQDDLYLSRMGYMGADELLSLSPLDFHPETGVWYRFRIETCRNRIRVFLNDEQLPRIDVEDANAGLAPQGYVTLGGGWITTEFDSLRIEPLDETALDNIPVRTYATVVPANAKENRRQAERASYTPVALDRLPSGRSEIALDGHWLFLPDYEVKGVRPEKPETGDQNWHVMTVPSFWNPIRIWLHGETMNQGKFPKGVSDTYYQQETARCEAYTFDYKKIKAAWYRQWIDLPQGMENKTVELQFDAVSKMADIYVNGVLVASHTGMFGEIKTDITKYLKAGKNLIAAYVVKDYAGDSGKSEEPDYYTIARLDEHPEKAKELEASATVTGKMLKDIAHGFYGGNPAGIWQPVKLIVASRIKIDDVFIRPTLDGASFEVTVKNYSGQKQNISLSTDIFEKETNHLFYSETSLSKIALKAGEERVLSYAVQGLQPRLWSPQSPSLYDFTFKIRTAKGAEEDAFTVRSGFRTFEVKDGLFHLNGKPYWLRGGNHTPFALAPNDATLANSFYQIMKAGNIDVTRTHTSPYNKLWVNAADENGIGISHEGTWPWLMINASMPDSTLIRMWADEYLSLLKKYRNHPSILFWTINNEMKFYDNEPNPAKRQLKMTIISDVVKRIREIDPTRPISFDSNYRRNEAKLGKAFYEGIDDGDIDDVHSYINWYDHTLFKQFNGEFQRDHKNEGRPLISQEMSTGYPNNETGHPTRFYTLVHQNPQTLVGYEAYAFGNPDYFLKTQAFITGELAEALRRSSDRASGIIHFALLTWFRNVYDAKNIEPYPAYYAMQRALQPALVSAELWGRNFYAGEKLPARICVVNDLESGNDLEPALLYWQIETENGNVLAKGKEDFPAVKHYTRQWITPDIVLPQQLPAAKTKAKLRLRLTENGREVSTNEYAILLADRRWTQAATPGRSIVLVDGNGISPVLDALNVDYRPAPDLPSALKQAADLLIISGNNHINPTQADGLRAYIASGRKVLMLNNEEAAKTVFPEHIAGYLTPTEGDIVNMEIPESPVFDGIDLLELRYFNNNRREIPTVCHAALQVNRSDKVTELANQTKIHGYINGNMQQRSDYVKTIKGFPIIKITEGKGKVLISTMAHDKAATDPVAARLLANMITAGASAQSHYETYKGLVMAGYQGWFNTPSDGAGRNWHHYGNRQGFAPGNCGVDFWPDVSDYPTVYETPFRFRNGTPAYVFSSADSSTVDVHFDWMKTFGVDGVFMQRFVCEIKTQKGKQHFDRVLKHALSSARRHDRAISIMYDLSGMLPGDERLLLDDIDRLDAEYGLTSRRVPTWLHHNGKPLVAVWGVGFNDRRKYGLKEAGIIIDGLKARGYSVMIGVPTHWRTLDDDAVSDVRLHAAIRKCDILLPWFVGRYNEESYEAFKPNIRKDMEWCAANGVDYAPLCYPGFSWRNKRGADSFYVDRNAGQFYRKQFSTAVEYGAEMLYIAMFDEMDEGTAIFKCLNRSDVPDNRRIPFDGVEDHLPTDYYLRLTGEAGRLLRERLGISRSPVDYVNPLMGNISHLLVPTYPTIHLPNSMLRVYPERPDYTADRIRGLPVAVTSHRGSSAFNISPLNGRMPLREPVESYTYDLEKIRPYRYSVYLDGEGVSVDYAPSHQSGVYNLRFEGDTLNRLIINTQDGALRVMGNGVSGYQQIENSATRIYLYLEIEQAVREIRPWEGNRQAMALSVDGRQINLRYGISFIDEMQAKRNLEREIGTYSVDEVAAAGRRIWNETLGKIQVEGDNEDDKTVFYTSLYRVCERMINVSEDGRYYSPFDHQVHADEGIPFYTDDWIWDTYRAAHPLRVLIAPAMETDMIRSYLRMAQQTPEGWMPTFPEITGDSHRMNGNHAVAVVWDAYCKGLTDFDLEAAYAACKGAITEKSLLPWKRIPNTVLDVFYRENGYYPALKPDEREYVKEVKENEKRQSVAITLGTSYDDWCLSQIARQLGRTDDYQYFLRRSYNYRNLYNPETAFFHPKDSAGRFIMPFDYRFAGGQGARDYYDENNGWTYRWDVQHNPADLIRLTGSPEAFADNLDQLFREPLGLSKYRFYAQLPDHTGNVGQFSMANEPSLHIPYLYNYAGQPWKTQKRIRSLLSQWFRNDLMGIPGDEDGGGLSSFVVFSAMGFYPVTPGMPVYNIGSPLFPRIRMDLGNGKVFEVEAVNCSAENKYIQSATLNGEVWERVWFSHSDIAGGGKLRLVMGDRANERWGKEAPPPAAEKID